VLSDTQQQLIMEFSEIEVLEGRMNAILSDDYQSLAEEKLVGTMTSPEGVVSETRVKELADALRAKEKFGIRKDKLRKQLVATPRAMREMALKEGAASRDASTSTARLLQAVRAAGANRGVGGATITIPISQEDG